jgi:hypothetical protein
MKAWWIWWANTNKNGLPFEDKVDFLTKVWKIPHYEIKNWYEIFYRWEKVAESYKKHNLYKLFLMPRWINYEDIISAKLLPDDAIFVIIRNTLFIVEIKFQECSWSTDEKLQTCNFKKWQYQRLTKTLWIDVEYCYVLNDWYKAPKYQDVLNYIQAMDCKYFFNDLPLDYLWLPKE